MLGLNPLRSVLDGLPDPSVLGSKVAPTLVIQATPGWTGEARLFRRAEVTAEVLLASACPTRLFPALEIGGEAYRDGGYAANPPLRSVVEADAPADIVLVRTSPVDRPAPLVGTSGLAERIDEIAFSAALGRSCVRSRWPKVSGRPACLGGGCPGAAG